MGKGEKLKFVVPLSFEQELVTNPAGFVPLSTQPGVVNPNLKGCFSIEFNKCFTRAEYRLCVNANNNNPNNFIRFAHLHYAPAYENGPIVVNLFDAPTPQGVPANGCFAEGHITNAQILLNTPEVNSVSSLYNAILENEIYVNVHSVALPAGAIRGQIFSNLAVEQHHK